MKESFKKLFSKRILLIVIIVLLALSGLNTYLIIEGNRNTLKTSVANYDFVLSKESNTINLKNMHTGQITHPKTTPEALNTALREGNSVYINQGAYTLNADVKIINKLNARIISNEAIIQGNGHKIIIYGTDYTTSQHALISGLTIINATIHVENSFSTTITNTKFINSSIGIEFLNTNTWSEYNKIENCRFINNTESIVFRTPINGTQINNDLGNATGSYASSIIERCNFNLQDFSTGIKIEQYAEFSDCQMQNLRFWMGENDQRGNQTALLVDGSMYQTVLFGVVFESFADDPVYMFAIDIGKNCDPAPIIGTGVSFLGNWTAKIHDPAGIWLSGTNTVFKREATIPVGTNSEFGETQNLECRPLTISEFKPKIDVGNLRPEETVTVRIRIEYIDNTISNSVTRTFSTNGSTWLSDEDMMRLFASQNIIWTILVDAKTNAASTNTKVTVSGYGIAT
ncbi:MAG: hypothetical protein LBQ98_08835 [Nitrososphaerota archaeon]|jgi:hypothetical protein|nr:hypothetical protein [Nitrososphaerota archaeon]